MCWLHSSLVQPECMARAVLWAGRLRPCGGSAFALCMHAAVPAVETKAGWGEKGKQICRRSNLLCHCLRIGNALCQRRPCLSSGVHLSPLLCVRANFRFPGANSGSGCRCAVPGAGGGDHWAPLIHAFFPDGSGACSSFAARDRAAWDTRIQCGGFDPYSGGSCARLSTGAGLAGLQRISDTGSVRKGVLCHLSQCPAIDLLLSGVSACKSGGVYITSLLFAFRTKEPYTCIFAGLL